uniref:Uncharacterized protein n=1 Tax=Tetranychus urticae TaxID=32264 RepID=T1K6W3_TETUR
MENTARINERNTCFYQYLHPANASQKAKLD